MDELAENLNYEISTERKEKCFSRAVNIAGLNQM
jgi:hypothetical protein